MGLENNIKFLQQCLDSKFCCVMLAINEIKE